MYFNDVVAQETFDSELFSEKEIINFYKSKFEYFYSESNIDSTNISSSPDSLRIYIVDDDINGLKSLKLWASENGFNSKIDEGILLIDRLTNMLKISKKINYITLEDFIVLIKSIDTPRKKYKVGDNIMMEVSYNH